MTDKAYDRIVAQADADGFVNFGDVARGLLGMQAQYASDYVIGVRDRPSVADDLRVKGKDGISYHSIRIHKDDVAIFVERVEAHRKQYR